MQCPECGAHTADDATRCPDCGVRLESTSGEGSADGDRYGSPRAESPGPNLSAAVSVSGALLGGVGVFVSGFVLTATVLVFEVVTAASEASGSLGGSARVLEVVLAPGPTGVAGNIVAVLVRVVGWIFFNAHQVPIVGVDAATPAGTETPTESLNVLAEMSATADPLLTPLFYYAIPPLVLAVGGYRVAAGTDVDSPVLGLVPGGSIALGYVPVAFAVAAFVGVSPTLLGTNGPTTVGPDPATAAAMAGLYAVVCGAVGGGLAGLRAWTAEGGRGGGDGRRQKRL